MNRGLPAPENGQLTLFQKGTKMINGYVRTLCGMLGIAPVQVFYTVFQSNNRLCLLFDCAVLLHGAGGFAA